MNRYCGIQFLHPTFETDNFERGLALTLTGGTALVCDEAAIRQAILMLLSTSLGERVMRTDYGCSLNKLVFSPNDETTAGIAMHYVREAIQKWEPRIEIVMLDAGRFDESTPDRMSILLSYRIKDSGRRDSLQFDINLQGT